VQGVKKGENPDYTTLWSVVGFPLTSMVVPTWLKGENDFPQVLKINDELKDSPICNAALSLKEELFPIRWGKFASKYYININALTNADKTGIRQKIKPDEDEIFKQTYENLNKWRNSGMKKSEIKQYYDWLNDFVKKSYKKNFNLLL